MLRQFPIAALFLVLIVSLGAVATAEPLEPVEGVGLEKALCANESELQPTSQVQGVAVSEFGGTYCEITCLETYQLCRSGCSTSACFDGCLKRYQRCVTFCP